MKILLTSTGELIVKEGYKLLGIPAGKIRIGYITTATKGASDTKLVDRRRKQLPEAGYVYEEFDIEGKSKEEILNFFADKNVIHMEGGNTFYLLKAIRGSGFEEALRTLLDKGLAYVGSSAGAYIMCPDLEVATWSGRDRFGVENLTALNYVPFNLKVHYEDDMRETIEKKAESLKHPLRILRDSQGFFVENDEVRLVGEGEEVKLELNKERINDGPNKKTFGIN